MMAQELIAARRRFALPPAMYAGIGLVTAIALIAVAGPLLWQWAPTQRTGLLIGPPSPSHWLGTDEEGFDTLARLIAGARVALIVGPGTALLSALLGLVLGSAAGYAGGWLDRAITWLADLLLCFPGVLLALLVAFVSDRPGLGTVVLALSATGWAGHARLVRVLVASARERDFAVAARCLGASHPRVLLVHVLPEVLGPVAVQATFSVAAGVLGEASLSFLGVGAQGVVSWGAMLEQGTALLLQSPLVVLSSGLSLLALVTGVNLIGDALRDLLDPRRAGPAAS